MSNLPNKLDDRHTILALLGKEIEKYPSKFKASKMVESVRGVMVLVFKIDGKQLGSFGFNDKGEFVVSRWEDFISIDEAMDISNPDFNVKMITDYLIEPRITPPGVSMSFDMIKKFQWKNKI